MKVFEHGRLTGFQTMNCEAMKPRKGEQMKLTCLDRLCRREADELELKHRLLRFCTHTHTCTGWGFTGRLQHGYLGFIRAAAGVRLRSAPLTECRPCKYLEETCKYFSEVHFVMLSF